MTEPADKTLPEASQSFGEDEQVQLAKEGDEHDDGEESDEYDLADEVGAAVIVLSIQLLPHTTRETLRISVKRKRMITRGMEMAMRKKVRLVLPPTSLLAFPEVF